MLYPLISNIKRASYITARRHAESIHGIGTGVSLFTVPASSKTNFPKLNRRLSVDFSDRLRSDYTRVEAPLSSGEAFPATHGGGGDGEGEAIIASPGGDDSRTLELKPGTYKNRFLNFVRLGSVINGAAESFFKSEIRRRLFVTAVLIVISRVGYFIPLPGFDRRLIPEDYMSFVSGSSVGKLHYVHFDFWFPFVYGSHWQLNDIHVKTLCKPKKGPALNGKKNYEEKCLLNISDTEIRCQLKGACECEVEKENLNHCWYLLFLRVHFFCLDIFSEFTYMWTVIHVASGRWTWWFHLWAKAITFPAWNQSSDNSLHYYAGMPLLFIEFGTHISVSTF